MPNSIDKRNLANLAEWQVLREKITATANDYMDEILELSKRGNTSEMLDRCGRISMVKDILQMANELGGDKDAVKEGNKSEDD